MVFTNGWCIARPMPKMSGRRRNRGIFLQRSVSLRVAEYREHPDDFYSLRVGYGGTMGALTDIDQEGFASAAFHGFPDMLKPDPLSGDYGPNFFGHAWNTATYIVDHPQFGWLAFGGNIRKDHDIVRVTPQGMDHQRMCA